MAAVIVAIGTMKDTFINGIETGLQALHHIEFRTTFLILHQQVEFKLPVAEAVFEARRFETRISVR